MLKASAYNFIKAENLKQAGVMTLTGDTALNGFKRTRGP